MSIGTTFIIKGTRAFTCQKSRETLVLATSMKSSEKSLLYPWKEKSVHSRNSMGFLTKLRISISLKKSLEHPTSWRSKKSLDNFGIYND
jgi:hypothetical protein